MNTSQKIAVISGATGYVGFETAKKLSAEGMRIAMLYYGVDKKVATDMLRNLSGKGHCLYFCDISDENAVEKTINTVETEMGNIYVCVHSAGVIPKPKQLHLSSLNDLREQFEVNVFGSFNFLSACARRLKEHKGGVLIGITTAGVVTPVNTKARGAYSVFKFALQGALVALKEEMSAYGVRVYSIAPGVMPGGMNRDTPRAFIEIVRNISPTKRLTNAEEIAKKIAYLCSDGAENFTELTILVAPETEV